VYFELVANMSTAASSHHGVTGSMTYAAWQSQMARLGAWLSAEELMRVHAAYNAFSRWQDGLRHLRRALTPQESEELRVSLEEDALPAIDVVARRGFTNAERSRLMVLAAALSAELGDLDE
jgi:hypothetical protein